jgi:hypothetical protein
MNIIRIAQLEVEIREQLELDPQLFPLLIVSAWLKPKGKFLTLSSTRALSLLSFCLNLAAAGAGGFCGISVTSSVRPAAAERKLGIFETRILHSFIREF